MSKLKDPAKEAKILLGDTGCLSRIASLAFVYPSKGGWVVRAQDASGTAAFEIAGFIGPKAYERAIEYAGEKYSGVRELDTEF